MRISEENEKFIKLVILCFILICLVSQQGFFMFVMSGGMLLIMFMFEYWLVMLFLFNVVCLLMYILKWKKETNKDKLILRGKKLLYFEIIYLVSVQSKLLFVIWVVIMIDWLCVLLLMKLKLIVDEFLKKL